MVTYFFLLTSLKLCDFTPFFFISTEQHERKVSTLPDTSIVVGCQISLTFLISNKILTNLLRLCALTHKELSNFSDDFIQDGYRISIGIKLRLTVNVCPYPEMYQAGVVEFISKSL